MGEARKRRSARCRRGGRLRTVCDRRQKHPVSAEFGEPENFHRRSRDRKSTRLNSRSEEHTSELQSPCNLVPSSAWSTRLNSSHLVISYAVFCLKKKNKIQTVSTLITCIDLFSDHYTVLLLSLTDFFFFFFFNDTATTEIYTLSLHDALPIWKSTRLNSSHLVISYAVFCLEFRRVLF